MLVKTNQSHFFWLDTIRFLAAFMVVIVHTRNEYFPIYINLADDQKDIFSFAFYAFARLGNESVLVFFVLSGFLVGGKAVERIRNNTFRMKDYILDRSTRIMIPLIPALIFTAAVLVIQGRPIGITTFFGNMLGLQGVFVGVYGDNSPLWSLSYEVWFYVLVLVFPYKIFTIYSVNIAILFVIFFIFTYLHPIYLFCWLIGTFLYRFKNSAFSKKLLLLSFLSLIISTILMELNKKTMSIDFKYISYLPSYDVSKLLFSFSIGTLILQISKITPRKKFIIFIESLGSKLANSSYSLYLTHLPLLKLYQFYGIKSTGNFDAHALISYSLIVLSCVIFGIFFAMAFEYNTDYLREKFRKLF